MYGFLNADRMPLPALAAAVTLGGRQAVGYIADVSQACFGCEVAYGDTDSIFVHPPCSDYADLERIAREIGAIITQGSLKANRADLTFLGLPIPPMPGIMELAYEKCGKFLLESKKYYCYVPAVKGKLIDLD